MNFNHLLQLLSHQKEFLKKPQVSIILVLLGLLYGCTPMLNNTNDFDEIHSADDTTEISKIEECVIFFSTIGKIEPESNKKIAQVAQYFLTLQNYHPNAKLILHAYATAGSNEYRLKVATFYASNIRTKLIAKGINSQALIIISHDDRLANQVTFAVKLNVVSP